MLREGQQFSRFRILRRLGGGGMGEVFLAEDSQLKRNVALKILHEEFFDNRDRLERFHREARTAAQISHPNVAAIFDIGSANDEESGKEISFIVMEYIEGEVLSDFLQENKTDITAVIRLAQKIASGLGAAHKLNIVHRDIKSDNIVVTSDGEPKILDFGLAKPLEPIFSQEGDGSTRTASEELTKAGKIMGTVSYMSPEQAQGEPVDVRSDIFSFGVVLYRMATGEFPFAGPTHVSTLAKILESAPEPARSRNDNIPPELERIIDKCLQKNRDDRYQDTRDLVLDLRSLRRQHESGVGDTISTEVVKAVSTKKITFSIKSVRIWAAVAVLILVVLVTWPAIFDKESLPIGGLSAHENSLAILDFQNKTGDTSFSWLETGLPEIMLTDLAQTEALSLISRERILDCFDNRGEEHGHDEYVKAARSLGAVRILSGAFYKMGEQIRIDARLEDLATGKIILAEKVVGADPFPLVDKLTEKIIASLNLKQSKQADRNVASLMSSSSEAFRQYQEGMRLFMMDLDRQAIAAFEKATAIDSSFALPYLRIGMAHMFNNRPQAAIPYFKQASERKRNLPVRERNLLEIYAALWLRQDYDAAFTNMKTFVSNYPEDKEGRTIYALLLHVFERDTIVTFANLDTVLMIDPGYQLALSQYASLALMVGDLEKSARLAGQLKKYHPDSPGGYSGMAELYLKQNKLEEAINEYHRALELDPGNGSLLQKISRLCIRQQDFEKAGEYLEMLRETGPDDPYMMNDYYQSQGNIAVWKGHFRKSIEYRHLALGEAFKAADSVRIVSAYTTLGTYFFRFEVPDSARYYRHLGHSYTSELARLSYPMFMVELSEKLADSARPIFEEAAKLFREHVPSEMWKMVDELQNIFEAQAVRDTVALIDALTRLTIVEGTSASPNKRELGQMLIGFGRYDDGYRRLRKHVDDGNNLTNAYHHLINAYYLGIAEENLGFSDKAIEHYQLLLRFWGQADIELKEITDCRARLARLTS